MIVTHTNRQGSYQLTLGELQGDRCDVVAVDGKPIPAGYFWVTLGEDGVVLSPLLASRLGEDHPVIPAELADAGFRAQAEWLLAHWPGAAS